MDGGVMAKPGLYANIHAKQARIKAGSGEKMRKPGSAGAPTAKDFKQSAKTAKKNLKKAITRKSYNPEKDKTSDWNNLFRAYNPQAFDKFLNSLKPINGS